MGTPRVSTGPRAPRQSQIAPVGHNPDAHELAMDRLLGRDTPAIAREVGLARRTVQSWRDRDGEHRGPGRLLAQTIRASIAFGRGVLDALSPVQAILDEFAADIAFRSSAAGDRQGLLTACAEAMKQQAEAVQVALDADSDNRITPDELARIKEQCREARAAIDAVERAAEARAFRGAAVAGGGR